MSPLSKTQAMIAAASGALALLLTLGPALVQEEAGPPAGERGAAQQGDQGREQTPAETVPPIAPSLDSALKGDLSEWARKELRRAQLPGQKLQSSFAHYVAVEICAARRPGGVVSISDAEIAQARHWITAIDQALSHPSRNELWRLAYIRTFRRPPTSPIACQLNLGALQSYFEDVTGSE